MGLELQKATETKEAANEALDWALKDNRKKEQQIDQLQIKLAKFKNSALVPVTKEEQSIITHAVIAAAVHDYGTKSHKEIQDAWIQYTANVPKKTVAQPTLQSPSSQLHDPKDARIRDLQKRVKALEKEGSESLQKLNDSRNQCGTLQEEIATLKRNIEDDQPLLEAGIAVRLRFFVGALETSGDYQLTKGDLEAIEHGNRAAHEAWGLADEALLLKKFNDTLDAPLHTFFYQMYDVEAGSFKSLPKDMQTVRNCEASISTTRKRGAGNVALRKKATCLALSIRQGPAEDAHKRKRYPSFAFIQAQLDELVKVTAEIVELGRTRGSTAPERRTRETTVSPDQYSFDMSMGGGDVGGLTEEYGGEFAEASPGFGTTAAINQATTGRSGGGKLISRSTF